MTDEDRDLIDRIDRASGQTVADLTGIHTRPAPPHEGPFGEQHRRRAAEIAAWMVDHSHAQIIGDANGLRLAVPVGCGLSAREALVIAEIALRVSRAP